MVLILTTVLCITSVYNNNKILKVQGECKILYCLVHSGNFSSHLRDREHLRAIRVLMQLYPKQGKFWGR